MCVIGIPGIVIAGSSVLIAIFSLAIFVLSFNIYMSSKQHHEDMVKVLESIKVALYVVAGTSGNDGALVDSMHKKFSKQFKK
jgi:hypothetical protein